MKVPAATVGLCLAACVHASASTDERMLAWSQNHSRAAVRLCLWQERNVLAAPELVRWVRDHPAQAQELVLYGASHLGEPSTGAFYRDHPGWHRELIWDAPVGVLLAWAAFEPQAAQELAFIPHGLEWAQARIRCRARN